MLIETALLLTLASGPTSQAPHPAAMPVAADAQPSSTAAAIPVEIDGSAVARDNEPRLVAVSSPDSRRRIEVRFGGWADGSYSGHGSSWAYSGSGNGAFGLEYLSFVRNDLAIGIGLTSLMRADACGGCVDLHSAQAVTSIPFIVRWYPARRLTQARSVEPYATAGIGPVFGVDTASSFDEDGEWGHSWHDSTHVGTTFGGRIGGGLDFRLGRTFTVGLGGAWNWDSGFSDDLWRAPRPNGGEVTVAFGWNFGR
jgi:hypothetical protein